MSTYSIQAKKYGEYDVAVCGGGTAGVAAAIAAARGGAKTILIERTFSVGGMLTIGEAGITKFTEHCRDVDKYKSEVLDQLAHDARCVQVAGGIPHEFALRLIGSGAGLGTHGETGSYVFSDHYLTQLTLFDMLEEAGVTLLLDSHVCGIRQEGEAIRSILIHNKEGFSEIDAAQIIDATGDADVAAMAGVPFRRGASEEDIAEGGSEHVGQMQSFGTMYRVRGVDFERLFAYLRENPDRFVQHEFGVMSLDDVIASYRRGDMCVFRVRADIDGKRRPVQVYNLPARDEAILLGNWCGMPGGDGLDAASLTRGQITCQRGPMRLTEALRAVPGMERLEIVYVPDVGVRETRHIDGVYRLTGADVLSGRDFADSIGCGGHPIDIGPLPPELEHVDLNHWRFHIPFRIMMTKQTKNLLVTGRCVSATRLAFGALRPTVQCMVMGEAAGTAAALAVTCGCAAAEVDIPRLREILCQNGAIL